MAIRVCLVYESIPFSVSLQSFLRKLSDIRCPETDFGEQILIQVKCTCATVHAILSTVKCKVISEVCWHDRLSIIELIVSCVVIL